MAAMGSSLNETRLQGTMVVAFNGTNVQSKMMNKAHLIVGIGHSTTHST